MRTRTCSTCIHYKGNEQSLTFGSCEYPVPRWISTSVSKYVAGYEAQTCLTYAEAAYSKEEEE